MDFFSLDHYGLGTNIIDLNKYDKYVETHKDNKNTKKDATPALRLVVDATRSGSIVNRRSYTGASVRDASNSFIKPFAKPILKDHNSYSVDAIIGRAVAAEFQKLAMTDQFENDFLYAKPGSAGSGRTLVTTDILDSDAIVKFLDGRFATFSTGQRLSSMVCSHCGKDYFRDYMDEAHFPGQMKELTETSPFVKYGKFKEGHKMEVFGIAVVSQYDELSTVVTPAQPRALIEKIMNDFIAVNSIDSQSNPTHKKFALDLAKVLVSGHYSRDENSLYTIHMTDENHVSHSLMFNDYQAEIEQKVTGKTTVLTNVPAVNQNIDLSGSTDNEQTSQNNEAVEANDGTKKQIKENQMDPKDQKPTVDKAVFDLAMEAKTAAEAKIKTLEAEKVAIDGELKTAKAAVVDSQKQTDAVALELKDSYVKTLKTMRVASGHASIKDLDEKGLVAYETELKTRTLDSLKNSIADEMPAFQKLLSEFKDSINATFADGKVVDPTIANDGETPTVKITVNDALADL